jgi:hypothetical protein
VAPEKLARQAATLKMRLEKKPRTGMYAALGAAGAVLLVAGVIMQRHVSSAASTESGVDAGRMAEPTTSSSVAAPVAPTTSAVVVSGAPSASASPNSLPVPWPSSSSLSPPAASGPAAISPRPARSAPPRATPPPAPSHDSHWTPALK